MTKNREIFKFIAQDNEFMAKYLFGFMDRFVYTSADIEKIKTIDKRKEIIINLTQALQMAIDEPSEAINPYDIIGIANTVNESAGYSGVRNIPVSAGKYATFTPVEPRHIYNKLYELCAHYRDLWCDLDPYEREAFLHIFLMRTHPFEDGNKRTSRILLNSNLIRNGCAPVIITEGDNEEYYNYINEMNTKGFADFLKNRSAIELQNMISLYKLEKRLGIGESIEEYMQTNKSR